MDYHPHDLHYDEENCDEQRRRDRDEQRLINADLHTVKRLDFKVLLASSKDVFATEMKAMFDEFRSELLAWKTSINDSMVRNTTTLQVEITAAIDTPAATSLKATVNGLMDTVPTFMQEMQATISALSDTVKSLEVGSFGCKVNSQKQPFPPCTHAWIFWRDARLRFHRYWSKNPPPHIRPNQPCPLPLQPYQWCCRWIHRKIQSPRLPGSLSSVSTILHLN